MPRERTARLRTALSALGALFLGAFAAHASDGVLEINQTCLNGIGCFSGDPGGPAIVTIDGSAGKSYRLTSDLSVNQNTTAILISASDITIDLNGFSIRGPNVCTASSAGTTSCNLNGLGRGIAVDDPVSRKGIQVRNGAIVGMGSDGIRLGDGSIISDLTVRSNGRDGISVGEASRVSRVTAELNLARGIAVSSQSLIRDSVVSFNRSDGIVASFYTLVVNNIVTFNGSTGIAGGTGVNFRGNTVAQNLGRGLSFTSFPTSSSYGDNLIYSNDGGTISGSAVNAGGNACDGSSVCP